MAKPNLEKAAREVIAAWETGNLDIAVRTLAAALNEKTSEPPRVTVVIEGGCVRSIYSDIPNQLTTIIDLDDAAAQGMGRTEREAELEKATSGLTPIL